MISYFLFSSIIQFDSMQFYLYGAKSEQQLPRGALFCKVKTLQ